MNKPDFVNKENFESLMTEESDPLKNFETDKSIVIRISHRIIEILCDKNSINYGNVYRTINGFTFEVKNYRNKVYYDDSDYMLREPTKLLERIMYYSDRVGEIFEKYSRFFRCCDKSVYQTDGSKLYKELTDAYHDEFKKHLGYTVYIMYEYDMVKIICERVE